jgi:hypothetical protein
MGKVDVRSSWANCRNGAEGDIGVDAGNVRF